MRRLLLIVIVAAGALVPPLPSVALAGDGAQALQLAVGFTLTVAMIWLIPFLEDTFGWQWAFAFLVPGPILGVLAMLRLKSSPEAARIAGGLG